MTPNVVGCDKSLPGASKFGVFVSPCASIRNCSRSRSRIGNDLNSDTFNERADGARNSSNRGGSGDITYCEASGAKAVMSKYGFKICRVTGSRRSPRR